MTANALGNHRRTNGHGSTGAAHLAKCLEPGCNSSHRFRSQLRDHLENVHSRKARTVERYFQNQGEFDQWLSEIQDLTYVNFIASSKPSVGATSIKTIYECNRSGVYKGSKPGQVETGKMGHNCTASVESTLFTAGPRMGNIVATVHLDHYGHGLDCQFLRLSKVEREKIKSDLALQIPVSTIQSSLANRKIPDLLSVNVNVGAVLQAQPQFLGKPMGFYDQATGDDAIMLLNLVSTKYLTNLKRANCLGRGMRNADDGLSVGTLYEELKQQNPSPVLFYKPQNMLSPEEPALGLQDFCMVLQTEHQRKMLIDFGNDALFVDGTHNVTKYGFLLLTLHVRDDTLKGYPVGHLLTSLTESKVSISLFYRHLFKAIPNGKSITPRFIISDDVKAWHTELVSAFHLVEQACARVL